MPAITGDELVNDAFGILNVFLPGESVPNNDGQFARRFLNDMLSEWSQRDLFIPIIARERFDMIADKGSETNPYTIGPGGDLDTERPSNQGSITAANLVLTASSPEVRIPLGIYTDAAYDSNQIPSQGNTLPTGLYYNPYYDNDLGKLYLWPVPDTAENDLELFLQKGIAQFDDLTTTYYLPDGVPRVLKYNLADALQVPYGKQMGEPAQRIAVSSLATFKRSNTKLYDAVNDANFGSTNGGIFNIQTFANG